MARIEKKAAKLELPDTLVPQLVEVNTQLEVRRLLEGDLYTKDSSCF